MAYALRPNVPVDYVLLEDREKPEDQQTKFELRGMLPDEQAHLMDLSTTGTAQNKLTGHQAMLTATRFGLLGWRNLRHEAGGAEIPFDGRDHGGAKTEALARLTMVQIVELGGQVVALSHLKAAAGNG